MNVSPDIDFNIEERKPIWLALSDFYLDNELQDNDFKYIANKINESPYSFDQVKKIDKAEVFPVLYSNLLHPLGVWSGFTADQLISEIIKKHQKSNRFNRLTNALKYARLKGMYSDYWAKLEISFSTL